MTEQLSFLERESPPPPHRGGDTQVEAARKIAPSVNRLQEEILKAIDEHGGATNEELVHHTGIKLSTVCPRTWELRLAGIIEDSGERRKGNSGVRAKVWIRSTPSERR